VVERLSRDAGYEPVRVGGLDMAGPQEDMIRVILSVRHQIGPFLYRMAPPSEL
jgi:hypothetical protein